MGKRFPIVFLGYRRRFFGIVNDAGLDCLELGLERIGFMEGGAGWPQGLVCRFAYRQFVGYPGYSLFVCFFWQEKILNSRQKFLFKCFKRASVDGGSYVFHKVVEKPDIVNGGVTVGRRFVGLLE